MASSLIDQVEASESGAYAQAVERYHVLLARNQKPEAGDAEELPRAMAILGRKRADLPGDLAVVESILKAELLARGEDVLQDKLAEAKRRHKEVWARFTEERADLDRRQSKEMAQAERAVQQALATYSEAHLARESLAHLEDEWSARLSGRPVDDIRRERLRRERAGVQVQHGPGASASAVVHAPTLAMEDSQPPQPETT